MKIDEIHIASEVGRYFVKRWSPLRCQSELPIVLLHDSLGCVDLWRTFPEQLALHLSRPVIAYDRQGFGKSEARKNLPSYDFIEQEAELYFPHIKSALALDRYILLGHSVGGAMAINIAASDKSCVAVITMAAQAFVEQLTIKGIQEAKQAFQQQTQFAKLTKYHGEKALWVLNAWTEIWLAAKFRHWRLSAISQVDCPLLAIHGTEDEYGSSAFPRYIAEGAKGPAQLVTIENCGHMPHKTHSYHVLDVITKFLRQIVD